MPYIAIKAQPKDKAAVAAAVERINQVIVEEFHCPPEVISISYEEFSPAEWEERVYPEEIVPNTEHMYILMGKRRLPQAEGDSHKA